MDDSCAVCAENLDWVAYGSCGHREVCSTCVVRLRFIFSDRRCCICKTECPVVFVTKALGDYTKTISDFSTFPSTPKEGRVGSFWYHEETKVFFDVLDQYTKVKAMCRLSCTSCDNKTTSPRVRFKSVEHLKDHLNQKHKLHMCSLCLVGRKVFICEQKLFTKKQLMQHISSGDSEVDGNESERGGFTGHPMCEFCKTPFYGGNELYTHMSREHYTCHICQRLKPGQYEYYGNYDDLEVHFRNDHFLCEDESCLAKKFIVFQIEEELKKHNAIDHGNRMSRSQQTASLQIQESFQFQNSRHGRHRSYHRQPNLAVLDSQASAAINNGSRLGETSFPPLSVQANRSQSRFVQNSESLTMTPTTRIQHQTSRIATSGSSRAWPALNQASGQASITNGGNSAQTPSRHHARPEIRRPLASAIPQDTRNEQTRVRVSGGNTSGSSGNAKRNNRHHSSSSTPTTRTMEQQASQGVSEVQSANKSLSLVETIRATLGNDEALFKAFKDTSGKYRHGSIDARTYLEYVKGHGLSHLVLDMAKLCPDPKRQKELIDAHNAAKESSGLNKKNKGKEAVKVVESSSDSTRTDSKDRSDKGKTKVMDSSSANSGKQQCKKTSKFLRARLGEKSMAAVLDIGNSNAEPEPGPKSRSQDLTGGVLPLRGAWRRGSAKLFV